MNDIFSIDLHCELYSIKSQKNQEWKRGNDRIFNRMWKEVQTKLCKQIKNTLRKFKVRKCTLYKNYIALEKRSAALRAALHYWKWMQKSATRRWLFIFSKKVSTIALWSRTGCIILYSFAVRFIVISAPLTWWTF